MTERDLDIVVPMHDLMTRADRDVRVRVRVSVTGPVDDGTLRDALATALRSALGFAASKYGILPSELEGREGALENDSRDVFESRLRDAGARVEAYQILQAAVR